MENITKLNTHPLVNRKFCKWFDEENAFEKECEADKRLKFVNPRSRPDIWRRGSKCNIIQEGLEAAGETLCIDSETKVNIICEYLFGRIEGDVPTRSGKPSSFKSACGILASAKHIVDFQGWCPDLLVRWKTIAGVGRLHRGLMQEKLVRLQE